jgi:hypothetical protein
MSSRIVVTATATITVTLTVADAGAVTYYRTAASLSSVYLGLVAEDLRVEADKVIGNVHDTHSRAARVQ